MKKNRLLFLALSCFLLVMVAAGNSSVALKNASVKLQQEEKTVRFSVPAYPHTELDVRTVQVSPISSLHKLPVTGALFASCFSGSFSAVCPVTDKLSEATFSHKRYLSFIYPSHHFW